MKKVKLMLLSLTVLATVGGALAFSVKGPQRFCTAATVNNSCVNVACPNDRTGIQNGTQPFICTTPTSGIVATPCKNAAGTTLPCNATSVRILLDN